MLRDGVYLYKGLDEADGIGKCFVLLC
jgi:hypothetical protein